ncbi:uncharacterized protein LOC119458245 isoform X2 [Dermacentor silvarum]|uniref:uncharacterized protein LOC119458245 isoform X2 n=1 Tax=Dermacentor silvarum TaxID=543639 RepID=UPI00189ADF0D|nr:uncharacterized protein LOC119458245 isoform X2 [Dermacentor silvarum]
MVNIIVWVALTVLRAAIALESNAAQTPLVKRDGTPSVKEFVDTQEPIWTCISTEKTKLLCKVDVKVSSHVENIQFNRSFYMGYHNWTTYACTGTFDTGNQQEMRVTEKEREVYIETLLYSGINHTCGVFMVRPDTSDSTTWHELRIRNSSIKRRTDLKCTEHFRRVAGSEGARKMFRRQCLHMLQIGNAPYSRWELH